MTGQQVINCPNCGGNKVKRSQSILAAMGAILCVTIIGLPVGLPLLLISFFRSKKSEKVKFSCQECKHNFSVKRETFVEYEKQIG